MGEEVFSRIGTAMQLTFVVLPRGLKEFSTAQNVAEWFTYTISGVFCCLRS
jgi:hypothetical protein